MGEIGNVLSRVNEKQVQDFVNIIIEAKRIFVVGARKVYRSLRSAYGFSFRAKPLHLTGFDRS